MQVSVEKSGALERRVTVEIPEARIESAVLDRLKQLTRTVKIDGFRPGKAPLKVIQRRYGGRVRDEVVGEVLRSSLSEAMSNESLKPVGQPVIDPIETAPGRGLSYTATFEVYPEIELAPVETIEMERPVCEITDADIDKMVETLRQQNRTWREVHRASADGDQLIIDYEGTIDGEAFEGGSAADFELVLGGGTLIEGFEDGLKGHAKGEEITLELRFPERYRNRDLAGKPVRFSVRLKRVSEAVLPELDADFFAGFGVSGGDLDAFRAEIRRSMERERDVALKKRLSTEVLEKLGAANEVEVPKALIDNEVARIRHQARAAMIMRGMKPGEPDQPELPAEVLERQAAKRVKLGLIMAEIIKRAGIRADPTRVRTAVEHLAASYEDPAAVVKWHYQDPERLHEVEAMCLEEEAVSWVAQRAKVKERTLSFDDLMKPGQTGQNAGGD